MPSLRTFIDSPLFYDNVELSATDINILRNNAEAIKTAAVRGLHVHNIHRGINITNNNGYIFKGGFQYRTGLTTARFIIWSKQNSGMGTHDIVIYFDGVEVHRYNAAVGGLNVGGYTTVDVPINTRDYVDYQIISVDVKPIQVGTGGDASNGEQFVFDAYTFPYSSVNSGTWPGVPTFGTINATRLNQLSNALDYLANRVAHMPYPLQMSLTQWMGTSNPKYTKFRYFRVKFSNQNNRFKTRIYYFCQHISASIRLTIGGVTWNYGPLGKGENAIYDINVDGIGSGLSWDTDYLGTLEEVVHTPGSSDGNGGFIFSRISSGPLAIGIDGTYTLNATPATSNMLEMSSYSTIKTRLNAIATITDNAYTNIVAKASIYDRGYMFRGPYGIDDGQNQHWETTFIANKYRAGNVLWVKGKGIRIAYGATTIQVKTDAKPNDLWEYKFQYEEELLDGDKVSQSYFYLDQFKALQPGMIYYVLGADLHYAAEHLR